MAAVSCWSPKFLRGGDVENARSLVGAEGCWRKEEETKVTDEERGYSRKRGNVEQTAAFLRQDMLISR